MELPVDTHEVLGGIVLVEMCASQSAAALSSRILAECGALVFKVEQPATAVDRSNPAFAVWNRSKQSVVIDTSTDAGRSQLLDLLSRADVLLLDRDPAEVTGLDVDAPALSRLFPRLVLASVTGYPSNHPDRDRAAEDILVQAKSGLMDEIDIGFPRPNYVRWPLPTLGAAMLGAAGIIARLIAREKLGRGGVVNTSLFQGALAFLASPWKLAERPSPRLATKANNPRRPLRYLYRCRDERWIYAHPPFLTCPEIIESFLALGIVPPDAHEYEADEDRVGALCQQVFDLRSAQEWLSILRHHDVPACLVYEPGEILLDEQVVANGFVAHVDDPVLGPTWQAGPPFTLDPPCRVRNAAPRLGELSADLPAIKQRMAEPDGFATAGTASSPTHPLAGVKVLDLGMFVSSPLTAELLADLGADVIKVEPPTGDRMRALNENSFLTGQRGKRSLALDIGRRESRPVLERLIQWADVIIHNQRLKAAERLGIDPESVRHINPNIAYCRVSGYGAAGPLSDAPSYDPAAQAQTGYLTAGVPRGLRPAWLRFLPGDIGTGLLALCPALLGLYQRNATGTFTETHGSLLGTAVFMGSEFVRSATDGSALPYPTINDDVTGVSPGYRIVRCSDGSVAIAAPRDSQVDLFSQLLHADGADDLAAVCARHTAAQVVEAARAAGLRSEVVEEHGEAPFFSDPENRAAGLVAEFPHPVYGRLQQVGSMWFFDDLETKLDRAPPTLGQHSREILEELGVPDEDIRWLASLGALVGDGVL